jgi:hypothetical protein
MLQAYHIEILHLALDGTFSPHALGKIIAANLYQDRLRGQIGHDEYHFDNNAFDRSYAYIEEQRALTVSSLLANDALSAWSGFGRLTHTAQDFYAHSNYINLWLARQPDASLLSPMEVDPMSSDVTNSGALRSGKVYLIEILKFIPPLRPLVMSILPRDSHGWMNLDAPDRGPNFKYAFQAAVKRTTIEFEKTTKGLPVDSIRLFLDQ